LDVVVSCLYTSHPTLNRGVTVYNRVLPGNARLSVGENEKTRCDTSSISKPLNLGYSLLTFFAITYNFYAFCTFIL
jgi:hypothetical protein